MATEGRLQGDIARALGVSVMTYHRWRAGRATHEAPRNGMRRDEKLREHPSEEEQTARLDELQDENRRLRRLVTDLLLEKAKLEEML
jgi:hypothetical protein